MRKLNIHGTMEVRRNSDDEALGWITLVTDKERRVRYRATRASSSCWSQGIDRIGPVPGGGERIIFDAIEPALDWIEAHPGLPDPLAQDPSLVRLDSLIVRPFWRFGKSLLAEIFAVTSGWTSSEIIPGADRVVLFLNATRIDKFIPVPAATLRLARNRKWISKLFRSYHLTVRNPAAPTGRACHRATPDEALELLAFCAALPHMTTAHERLAFEAGREERRSLFEQIVKKWPPLPANSKKQTPAQSTTDVS